LHRPAGCPAGWMSSQAPAVTPEPRDLGWPGVSNHAYPFGRCGGGGRCASGPRRFQRRRSYCSSRAVLQTTLVRARRSIRCRLGSAQGREPRGSRFAAATGRRRSLAGHEHRGTHRERRARGMPVRSRKVVRDSGPSCGSLPRHPPPSRGPSLIM
jgi:hypothetical protein